MAKSVQMPDHGIACKSSCSPCCPNPCWGEGEMSWGVGVGADKRRMPNGTRKVEKWHWIKILARKTGKPDKATSSDKHRQQLKSTAKRRKTAKSPKVQQKARVENAQLDVKRREVKNREKSNSIAEGYKFKKSTSRNVDIDRKRQESRTTRNNSSNMTLRLTRRPSSPKSIYMFWIYSSFLDEPDIASNSARLHTWFGGSRPET